MLQFSFTEEEINLLKEEKANNPHPIIRRKAEVIYLRSLNIENKLIEKISLVSHTTITDYVRQYQQGGIESIKQLNYKGQPSKLNNFKEEIVASLDQNPVGTLKEAKARILEITGVKISINQVKEYLDKVGIKRRKVKQIPDKLDIEAQENFKKQELEPLIEKAKKKLIHLFFVDAAHFVHMPFLGFLYSLTAVFVKASAGRKRYNVLGALNAITKEIVTFTNFSYINSYSICSLMDELKVKYFDLPISLILDNAKYQNNKFVKAYADQLGIELVFLPAYSPNLNLIERLWKFIKKEVLYSTYYKNFSDFINAINQCLEDTNGKHKKALSTLLTLKFQSFENATIKP